MKKLNKISYIVVVIVAAIFTQQYFLNRSQQNEAILTKVDKQLTQMHKQARKNHPKLRPSIAFGMEARKKTLEILDSTESVSEKLERAANFFMGFYLINTRARKSICEDQGVNIERFVHAFTALHADEYAKALSIHNQGDGYEKRIWSIGKTEFIKMAKQEMQDAADVEQLTSKELCELLTNNAEAIVHEIHYSKVSPRIHEILMGATN